ncbi:sensor histidine kinase [Sphingomonas sp. AR_OL41]|uniref:sensor histidine kinase n=1 Tax=Sphingomonas sp. AR_OL41 TaxID=3042729 RepID=UPI0024803BD8|nr:sensor histidine kinase [Sphingomonas sp. AR_OL41]MDH7971369.1 sensor histidine kinase [Sphingomonas sp. AR_OL41]
MSLFARMPTGAKIFLILSAALLPLAIIAFLASLRTTETADDIAAAQLRVALNESARKLSNELIGDMTALRAALSALSADPGDAPSCARAQGVFAQQAASGTRFVILDRHAHPLCGGALPRSIAPLPPRANSPITARIIPGSGLTLSVAGSSPGTYAAAFFPVKFLTETAQPSGFALPHGARLTGGDMRLTLVEDPASGPLVRNAAQRAALGIDDLRLEMSVPRAPITSPVLLAMLLPILMWLAAACIGWLVVDALLLRPLQRLRRNVAAFTPGEEIDPGDMRAVPSHEIRDLGDTFRALSRTVAAHEAGLAEGLVRQTRLTREVHHRVKNNLQVISSLINFHARGARSQEASDAYSSIQRRVDALAVVHRHHFAELEENRGLSLRSVIGELSSNLRATAPDAAKHFGIVIDVDPYLVTQDTAIAITFLLTELIEMAMTLNPATQVRVSVKPGESDERAVLRVNAPALVDGDALRKILTERYGRVIEGLSRQLRAKLHHDPLVGAYEITIAVSGRD